MRKVFKGKKKFITIPLAIVVGLFFLPLTILFLITWLVNSRVSSKRVKNASFSVIGVLALLFGSVYAVGIASPSTQTEKINEQTTTTTKTIIEENNFTSTPTLIPTKPPTSTITPKPTKKPTPTIKPTSTPVPTFKPTAIPVIKVSTPIPTQTQQPSQGFTCIGKTTCGEMTSCEEAYFYLNICGVSGLDRDKDGIPCESICI